MVLIQIIRFLTIAVVFLNVKFYFWFFVCSACLLLETLENTGKCEKESWLCPPIPVNWSLFQISMLFQRHF